RVVEAGWGGGGFARHMARRFGVEVTACNISAEQIRFARERAELAGLSDRVRYIEEDYRNIEGEFDAFVSVGMLEHVGPAQYERLGETIDRCLKPGGLGLIHTIGRNDKATMNPWIERRIFPGAHPPSLKEMMAIFEPNSFSVLDVENLRLHYRETTAHWLKNFEEHADEVRDMFDEEFVRTWRLYLAGSTCTFDIGRLQLFQVLFSRERNNDVPLTRRDIYTDEEPIRAFT
ncbi:MAG: class I SAM-dependent methyltransferase, partial [Pseudomonadales bacterium]|nr:class I SAM-dependent methyltransferase [Pseudomonadales bacterium]